MWIRLLLKIFLEKNNSYLKHEKQTLKIDIAYI